ncbi:ATP synthase B chain [Streptococcus sp. DD10]|uniref:F0F1 ATP synthase subunit B n=1 Tax=Streptococcus sp. DD10 TaxID=1777878 RepID=UPI0007924F54|nr:F0F1 ATP synthase subunit B [Streptococcus sp. DD10]KXT76365.1 ATP synthase B chain [Streptococcus sp. DD10]
METSLGTIIGNIILVTGSVFVLFLLIRKYAWGNITSIFEERAQKISDDLDNAEQARQQAEELAHKREIELAGSRKEASQIIGSAKETAEKNKTDMLTETKSEIIRLKEKANQEIEQNRKDAIDSIKGEVADLTILLAGKIMTDKLEIEGQSDLIDRYIDRLGDA